MIRTITGIPGGGGSATLTLASTATSGFNVGDIIISDTGNVIGRIVPGSGVATALAITANTAGGFVTHGGTCGTLTGNVSGSSGSCTGNASTATLASTVTVADTTDSTCFVALFEDATGSLGAKTDAGLAYNAATGFLNVGATTANGSASVVGSVWIYKGTGVAHISALASAATSLQVNTLPDASGTIITTGNLSSITAVGTVTSGTWNGTVIAATYGGTGLTTYTQGDLIYSSAANTLAKLAKDTNATRYLANTGTSNNPAWAQVALATGVSGTLPVANGGTGNTTMPLFSVWLTSDFTITSSMTKVTGWGTPINVGSFGWVSSVLEFPRTGYVRITATATGSAGDTGSNGPVEVMFYYNEATYLQVGTFECLSGDTGIPDIPFTLSGSHVMQVTAGQKLELRTTTAVGNGLLQIDGNQGASGTSKATNFSVEYLSN